MALRQAKVQPTLQEKRYITLQMLEGGYMHGSKVDITPVENYELTTLSGEQFTYGDKVSTYIIYDERPKVSLLKSLGWYREDAEMLPQVAYIPTHLLYDKETGEVVNEVALDGNEMTKLVQTGVGDKYELKPLKIIRGTLIDVYYDFLPDAVNRFYVVDVRIDTVSINYTCRLMPYKYDSEPEGTPEQNESNHKFIKFNSDNFGV